MKKFLNCFMDIFVFIASIICFIFLILIVLAYVFSLKNNMTFQNSITYFETIISEVVDIQIPIGTHEQIIINTSSPGPNETLQISNYYYQQLDETAKTIYNTFEINIDNLKKDNYIIDFSTSFNDLLQENTGKYKLSKSFQSSLDAFFYDHPELFYIDIEKIALNTKCTSIGSSNTYTVQIIPRDNKNYLNSTFNSEEEVNIAITTVQNIRKEIISEVSDKNDIYDKLKKIHDILVKSIDYDTTLSKNNVHDIYGALVNKEAVCAGYAKAFKYIFDHLNIDSILVIGNGTNSSNETEAHMWNYVKIEDSWYGVDVTWDDPIIIGGSMINNLRHNYFLKGYYSFSDSHIPSERMSEAGMMFTLPILSTENYRW